ncbi:MAG: ester cyclase [Streptosporangiaceae bacterium]
MRTSEPNGVLVGVAGPKRRTQERLADFPDLTTTIEDMFSAHDKIITRLVRRGMHTGPCGASTPRASRWRSVTLPFGASKTAR